MVANNLVMEGPRQNLDSLLLLTDASTVALKLLLDTLAAASI